MTTTCAESDEWSRLGIGGSPSPSEADTVLPVANLVRTLAHNKVIQKFTKNDRIRSNRYYQALRYSVVRKPLDRKRARLPIALKIRVNSKIDIEPGQADFFAALRGVVWADPLRVARWDHIAVWRVNKDQATTRLANELSRDRKSTRLNSSHLAVSRMPSSA